MSRVSDHGVFAEQTPRGFGWQVVLTQVNACCASRKCDINAVVDDELNAAFGGNGQRGSRLFVKLQSARTLLADLHYRRATFGKHGDLLRV